MLIKRTLVAALNVSFVKVIAAAALTAVTATAHAADNRYTNIVFFGDSLTDSGYFFGSKFTTNPDKVWAQNLAADLGYSLTQNAAYKNQVGNNFAIGGAKAGNTFVHASGLPIVSAKDQVAQYVARGVDGDALHVVWVGANDLLAAQTSASAQADILAAANAQIAAIKTLVDNGARNIMLVNVPDVGLTPAAAATGNQVAATAAAQAYNTIVAQGVAAIGANVVPLDTFGLLQEVVANPAAFGVVNTTAQACTTALSLMCTPATLAVANANQTYFFADSVHPTGKAHQLLADYAKSVLTAEQTFAAAPMLHAQNLSDKDSVLTQLNGGDLASSVAAGAVNNATNNNAAGGIAQKRAWLVVSSGDGQIGGSKIDKTRQALAGFAMPTKTGQIGVFLGEGVSKTNAGAGGLHIDERKFGAFGQGELLGATITLSTGVALLEADSRRVVGFSGQNHSATAQGKRLFADATVQKALPIGAATLTPHLGATYSRVRLAPLRENSASATAVTMDEQKSGQIYGTLGVGVQYPLANAARVFADVSYQDRLADDTTTATLRLNSTPNFAFSTPIAMQNDKTLRATLGVAGDLLVANKTISGKVFATHSKGLGDGKDDKEAQIAAQVGVKF